MKENLKHVHPGWRSGAVPGVNRWRRGDQASRYAAAVRAAGGTVTAGQVAALRTFITGEKAAGRSELIKRLYLPIWGVPGANALDLITLIPGTFGGSGMTHSAGFIAGDGISNSFLSDASSLSAGLLSTSATLGFLRVTNVAINKTAMGTVAAGVTNPSRISESGGICYFDFTNFVGGRLVNDPLGDAEGIITARAFGGNLVSRVRRTAGISLSATGSNGASGATSSLQIAMTCQNNNGTIDARSQDSYGAFFFGLGMSDSDDAAFTSALKNLWESCTGLTLP